MDIYLSLVISSVGLAYFVYGKKQADFHFLIGGIILMIYPYFASGIFLILFAILLILAPFVTKRFF